jgi:serine/threonine-protein kinase HipA
MDCTIQVFVNNFWRDCATVSALQADLGGVRSRAVFEYDIEYAFEQEPVPVAVQFPVDAVRHSLPHWPAFLFDLIPQGNGRKYLLGRLKISEGKSSDFPLICAGAFNPIGRIRVKEAVDYFQKHIDLHAHSDGLGQGLTHQQILARDDVFTERMLVHSMLAAGTTGIQGAAPKYLLTKDRNNLWHADGALPDAQATAHYIVKLPRGKEEVDRRLLRNEAAYMRVAKRMGLHVHGDVSHEGNMLFIPRFDRQVVGNRVLRIHQESAASACGIVGFDARPTQFELIGGLRAVVTDKTSATIEFLKRDVLNLAMRNTDNHARNTAIQMLDGRVHLAPLFDFAPMYMDPEGIARAVRWYHPVSGKELVEWGDVLEAMALNPIERKQAFSELRSFGSTLRSLSDVMRAQGVDDDINEYLQKSIDEQVRQLCQLPEVDK